MPLPTRSRTPASAVCGLYALLAPWIMAGMIGLNDSPAHADSPAAREGPEPRPMTDRPTSKWPYRVSRTAPAEGLDRSWWGLAGITAALAVSGGIYAACRRFLPPGAAGAVQVVGRMSLSPKHSVYVLRVGRRVLLVGTGPQGAPSLITELDELPEVEPELRQGGAT
jgi:flagellar protein FliO/FliZ